MRFLAALLQCLGNNFNICWLFPEKTPLKKKKIQNRGLRVGFIIILSNEQGHLSHCVFEKTNIRVHKYYNQRFIFGRNILDFHCTCARIALPFVSTLCRKGRRPKFKHSSQHVEPAGTESELKSLFTKFPACFKNCSGMRSMQRVHDVTD